MIFAGVMAASFCAQYELAKAEHEEFMASIADLPETERQRRIERREDRMTAERHHRAMVEAAQPKDNSNAMLGAGVLGFIFGMGVG